MERSLRVEMVVLPHGESLPLPEYQTGGSAGVDLYSAEVGDVQLAPGERRFFPTGIQMAIPVGWEGQVRPRSGLAAKHLVTVVNSPGTLDSDYRGEILVALINHGKTPYDVHRGDRIAQLVFTPVGRAEFVQVEQLDSTERGSGGFGSTGR